MPCRWAYSLLVTLAAPYAFWRIFRRFGKAGAPPWREYLGFCPPIAAAADAPSIAWIHAVSLGEAQAAAPLAQWLQNNGNTLLLTYTTPAGRDFWRDRFSDATITALPLDFPLATRRFFTRTRPALGVLMEAEYWPNLIAAARTANVRLILANARLGAKNARRYRKIAHLLRPLIGAFDVIAAQTPRDAQRLRCYGGRRVTTAGNLKFDLPSPPPPRLGRLHAKPTLLFAVTRAGEEQQLLHAATQTREFWRHTFVAIAPRHPERRTELAALLGGRRIALRSRHGLPTDECEIFIADTFGEMHEWYAACDIAIIGGSFLPHGGQNPIEALRAGAVTVVGPHMQNYAALTRQATAAGAMAQAAGASEAIAIAHRLLNDPSAATAMRQAAHTLCAAHTGALARHTTHLRHLTRSRQ